MAQMTQIAFNSMNAPGPIPHGSSPYRPVALEASAPPRHRPGTRRHAGPAGPGCPRTSSAFGPKGEKGGLLRPPSREIVGRQIFSPVPLWWPAPLSFPPLFSQTQCPPTWTASCPAGHVIGAAETDGAAIPTASRAPEAAVAIKTLRRGRMVTLRNRARHSRSGAPCDWGPPNHPFLAGPIRRNGLPPELSGGTELRTMAAPRRGANTSPGGGAFGFLEAMRPTRIELATFGLKDRRSLDPVKGPLTTELRAPARLTLAAWSWASKTGWRS
jgi:hypothetical protein